MKHVLFIAYFFPPAGGAAVHRTARFAKYLRDFGYEPIVLAPEPRTYEEDPLSLGVDRSFLAELPKDLRIVRVPPSQPFALIRLLKRLKLLWVFNFFVRPDEKLTWSFAAIRKGMEVARSEDIDLIYQNLGPWSTSLVGCVLKSRLKKPLVFDVRDPWTQWALGDWPTPLHFWIERRLERKVVMKADGISMLGDLYRAELLATHPGLDPSKVVAIPNGYDTAAPPPAPRAPDGFLRIVHAGKFYDTWGRLQRTPLSAALRRAYDLTLGRIRYRPRRLDTSTGGPRFLLEGLARAKAQDPAAAARVRIEFIGRLHPNVRRMVEDLGLGDQVSLPGLLPHDECLARMFQADALFLPFCRNPNDAPLAWLPLKLYEYLQTCKPVLAAVPEGDIKDTLVKAGTGVFVKSDDSDAFAAALLRLSREHAAGGIRVSPDREYIATFHRRALTQRLAALMDTACARAAQSAPSAASAPSK